MCFFEKDIIGGMYMSNNISILVDNAHNFTT